MNKYDFCWRLVVLAFVVIFVYLAVHYGGTSYHEIVNHMYTYFDRVSKLSF